MVFEARTGLSRGDKQVPQLCWRNARQMVEVSTELLRMLIAHTKSDLRNSFVCVNHLRERPAHCGNPFPLWQQRHAPDGKEHGAEAFVFGNEVGAPVKYWRVNEAWNDTCEAAGINGLHFHDLRRELGSTLSESGAPNHIVAAVLGHADISTTSRYLKASRAGLAPYMKGLEAHRAQRQRPNRRKRSSEQRRSRFAHHSHIWRQTADHLTPTAQSRIALTR